jgi:hypothetical protein
MNEELDDLSLDDAPKTDAQQVIEHFSKDLPGPESAEALAETPLAYSELCEPLLKELYVVVKKRKLFEKYEKELKVEVKTLSGKDRGMLQRGAFGVKLADTKGRETTDWKRFLAMVKEWAHHEMSDEGKKDVERMLANCTTTGEPGLTITPYAVGQPPEDDE